MAMFEDEDSVDKEISTFGAYGGEGYLTHEQRQRCWRDSDHIAYSKFFAKLYDDKKLYQLIEDLRNDSWWQKIENGTLKNRIKFSPTAKQAIKSGWPTIQEDADLLFRDLKAIRRKNRNYIRDEITNFFANHLKELEILITLAVIQLLTNIYNAQGSDFAQNNEDMLSHEEPSFILEAHSSDIDLAEYYGELLESALITLLSGATPTPSDGGISENLENTRKIESIKIDDEPYIRRI